MPILYQGRLLGLLELHHEHPHRWQPATLELAEAIANQVGVALLQAEAYQHLEELNRQLAALDQAKSELIAVTGHELRTPLSTIQVCLESLASDPDMPLEMRQEMLNTALQDADRLRELVQDFLTLSKLESGRVRWHIEPLSAQECVELALSNVKARRRHEDLPTIEQALPKRLPMVRADGEWLVEVLRKLLDNACKFTPPSGRIWIRAEVEPPAGEPGEAMVRFTVADSGRGIEPERLQAIFERFYQAEGSLRRSVGGTGLGLAICRLIVEAMGGRIWAESPGINQGSAFHFTLPIANPRTQTQPSMAA
jgi:signal transduction histidine kinase